MESPWGDDLDFKSEMEWSKMSSEFKNAGYREGITAGKESTIQQGFDHGFATRGVLLGRELGISRGLSSAIYCFLTSISHALNEQECLINEACDVDAQFAKIQFGDIAPRNSPQQVRVNEGLRERQMDGAENKHTGGPHIALLKERLETLTRTLGFETFTTFG